MAEQLTGNPTPRWETDPLGRHQYRYWDGAAWTDQVADDGTVTQDPLVGSSAEVPPAARPAVPTVAPASPPVSPAAPMAPPVMGEEAEDIAVNVTPEQARDAVVAALQGFGFQVDFQGPWVAVAHKGSKGLNVAFGAMAQYFEISLQIFTGAQGETVVRLVRDPVGYWGGVVGRARAKGKYVDVVNQLVGWFEQQGMLVGVGHTG